MQQPSLLQGSNSNESLSLPVDTLSPQFNASL